MNHEPVSPEEFARTVSELIGDADQVVVPASALTRSAWDTLCFERHDRLHLRFTGNGREDTLELPYESYFVDEAHVAGSLEDACVRPGQRIVLRRKYPGFNGPIEFLQADQA